MAAKNIYSFSSFRLRSFFVLAKHSTNCKLIKISNIFLFSVDEIPEENKTDFRLYSNGKKMLKKWPKAAHEIPVKIWFISHTIVRPKFFTWSVFKQRNPMNWILSRINITMMGWLSEQFPSECLWCGGDRRRDWLKIYVNAIEPSDGDTNSYNGNDDARQDWPDVRRGETWDLSPRSSIHHFVDNFRWKHQHAMENRGNRQHKKCQPRWWMFYQLGLFMYVLLFIIRSHNNKKSQNSSACSLNSQRAQKSSVWQQSFWKIRVLGSHEVLK